MDGKTSITGRQPQATCARNKLSGSSMFHLAFNELTSTVHAGENAEFRKNCTLRLAAG